MGQGKSAAQYASRKGQALKRRLQRINHLQAEFPRNNRDKVPVVGTHCVMTR